MTTDFVLTWEMSAATPRRGNPVSQWTAAAVVAAARLETEFARFI